MMKSIGSKAVLAATFALAGAMSFAQSGEAVYKSHCQSCHGAAGVPNPGIAKILGVKPASDPSMKNLSEAQMIAAVKNGKGKMKPVAGVNDAEIKSAVEYFRMLAKK